MSVSAISFENTPCSSNSAEDSKIIRPALTIFRQKWNHDHSSSIMSVLANAPRFWAMQGQAFLYPRFFLKIFWQILMRATEGGNKNCTLFARISATFALASWFKLAPIFWNKMTAKFYLFSSVHLFWAGMHIMSGTCHAGITFVIEDQRLRNRWKSFWPRRECTECHLSAWMSISNGTLGPQNFSANAKTDENFSANAKTDENWGNQWLQLVCE